jgi:PEP-CTERM motif-containing protein
MKPIWMGILLCLVLIPPKIHALGIEITSGSFGAGPGGDFAPYFQLQGSDFSMSGTPPSSGWYMPPMTSPMMSIAGPGSTTELGWSGTWWRDPYNIITYQGQSFPHADGHFSFSTPPIVLNFTSPLGPGAPDYHPSAPFAFTATAVARASPQGSALHTFDLRGQGLATARFTPCSPDGMCFSGISYQFQAPASAPPAQSSGNAPASADRPLPALSQIPTRPGVRHVIFSPSVPFVEARMPLGVEVLGQLPNGNVALLDVCRGGGFLCAELTAEVASSSFISSRTAGGAGLTSLGLSSSTTGAMAAPWSDSPGKVINPEPATVVLMGTGAAWLLGWRRKLRHTVN